MRKWILSFAVLGAALVAAADRLPETLTFGPHGQFSLGPVQVFLQHFGSSWRNSPLSKLKAAAGYPEHSETRYELRGQLPTGDSDNGFEVSETVTATGENAFRCNYSLTAAPPVATKSLALAIDIPVGRPDIALFVGGSEVILPQQKTRQLLHDRDADQVIIVLPERQIRITGDFRVVVQDNRSFKQNTFTIRLKPKVADQEISNWKFAADFQLLPPPAGSLPVGSLINGPGNLKIGNRTLDWTWYQPGWVRNNKLRNFKTDTGFPRLTPDQFEFSGEWNGFRTAISAVAAEDGGFIYSARFQASPPIHTAALGLVMTQTVGEPGDVRVDGRKVELPKEFRTSSIFSGKAHSLKFECNGRTVTLEGDFPLLIQDDRKWNHNYYLFRIGTTPSSGKIADASLHLRIRVETPRIAKIDLKDVFNAGFQDEKASDGKGGWSAEEPTGDLHMLKPGTLSALGVEFDIGAPGSNGERSCLVLSSGARNFPTQQSVMLPQTGKRFPYLYLLHASARTPKDQTQIGTLVAEYANGVAKEFPVLAGRDVGDWLALHGFTNSAIAWIGESRASTRALFLSQFEVGDAPKKLTFKGIKGNGNTLWMIAGATLGDRKLDLRQSEVPSYYVEGEDWLPVEFSGSTVAGSPLDFSGFLDAPAGKYGPVTVSKTGHFEFRDRPGERIRFFGANLVHNANFLSKETADQFVEKAVRTGYNSVRLHHYENGLVKPGTPDSLTFNPKALDQFDYLFAELKKHGIYLCLDLYASRDLRPGDQIKEREGIAFDRPFELKTLIPISESAMANWKEFARRLLTHRNPYTGLTYAEDPALYSLNLVNENPLTSNWNSHSALIPLFEKKYVDFLKKKGLDTPENRVARGGLFIEFLNDLQIRSIEEQKRFLKEELKLVALITDINMLSKFTLHEVRGHLEFVDNHLYWDHPNFPVRAWNLPHLYSNLSSVSLLALFPRALMPARIFGKPYTVTEFNFCNPNPYRLEAAPLVGGYAGVQDWDGLYRFAWSHSRDRMKKVEAPIGFDIVNDPQAQLAERIIHLLFLRNYIRPAEPAFAFTCTPEQIRALPPPPAGDGEYPQTFTKLGLYGRIGTLSSDASFPGVRKFNALQAGWEKQLPTTARAVLDQLEKTGVITSADGQITLDSKARTLKIVAPQCELLTCRGALAGRILRLTEADRYQTAALLSLDGKPLTASAKLLFVQMPNSGATMQKFTNERRNILESWGKLPILLEKCHAEVELALPQMKVEALKLDGSPNGAVPTTCENGKLRFTADTASRPGGVMVYLLTR